MRNFNRHIEYEIANSLKEWDFEKFKEKSIEFLLDFLWNVKWNFLILNFFIDNFEVLKLVYNYFYKNHKKNFSKYLFVETVINWKNLNLE